MFLFSFVNMNVCVCVGVLVLVCNTGNTISIDFMLIYVRRIYRFEQKTNVTREIHLNIMVKSNASTYLYANVYDTQLPPPPPSQQQQAK